MAYPPPAAAAQNGHLKRNVHANVSSFPSCLQGAQGAVPGPCATGIPQRTRSHLALIHTHTHTYGSGGDRAPARASCGTVQCAATHPFRKRATLRSPPSRALDHVQVRRPLPVSRSHATAVLSAERGEHPSCACPCFLRLIQCFCVCAPAPRTIAPIAHSVLLSVLTLSRIVRRRQPRSASGCCSPMKSYARTCVPAL